MRTTLPLLLLAGSTAHALHIPRVLNATAAEIATHHELQAAGLKTPPSEPTVVVQHAANPPIASAPTEARPILPGDDDAAEVHAADGVEDEPYSVKAVLDEAAKREAERWACDVRAWVRAADLQPNVAVQADARLAANGTACSDLKSWAVGLRYKERQITRLHAPGARFPVKPEWSQELDAGRWGERGDIFDMTEPWRSHSSPFDDLMAEYNAIISDPALWAVHGAEHVLFDSQLELASVAEGEELPLAAIQSFQVVVPNVNLPARSVDGEFSTETRDGEMVSSESRLEYYFALTLHNGSTLDFPAGHAGFLPSGPDETADDKALEKVVLNLESRRHMVEDDEYPFSQALEVPACDEGNLTTFRLEVDVPKSHSFAQGSTTTLHATLFKTSNGTEYPTNLTTSLHSTKELPWLAQFPRAVEANLTRSVQCGGWFGNWRSVGGGGSSEMVCVPSDEDLERLREEMQGRHVMRFGGFGDDWGSGDAVALDPAAEVQQIEIPVKIPYNQLPTFETAFVHYLSALKFRISTRFGCVEHVAAAPAPAADDDDLWTAWRLPLQDEGRHSRRQALNHFANVSIAVVGPPPTGAVPPTHYLAEGARAPVLAKVGEADVAFPPIGAVVDEEGADQLKQHRYGRYRGDDYRWWRPSGEYEHAAKVWQRYEKTRDAAAAAAAAATAPDADVANSASHDGQSALQHDIGRAPLGLVLQAQA